MRMTRREAVQYGIGGAAGLMLAGPLSAARALAAPSPAVIKPKAKSVIQIWMWGGPSQLDTFDPKPDAGADYVGPFTSPIATNVDGIRICEMLPELAKIADKYSIIRSMTHGNNGHETAAYMVQTGWAAGGSQVFPGAGAVVSLFKGYAGGYQGKVPPYIVLSQLQGRFSEAGCLGSRAQPFATGGDPNAARFAVEGIVAEGITDQRQRDRRELLHNLDSLRKVMHNDARVTAQLKCEDQAYDMILGDAGKVFDLSQESEELRLRYGRTTFGQSCLMARRLVERGVPFVTINSQGWDTHKQHFPAMRRKLPDLDKGLATLLSDLSQRGLLDSTIVWCCGEFGRTPKIAMESPWDGGRHHHGNVFSCLLAGGGFRGGQVVGASDAKGEAVKDRPVYPADVIETIYDLMGIDGSAPLPNPQALPLHVAPTAADGIKMAGRLVEIL